MRLLYHAATVKAQNGVARRPKTTLQLPNNSRGGSPLSLGKGHRGFVGHCGLAPQWVSSFGGLFEFHIKVPCSNPQNLTGTNHEILGDSSGSHLQPGTWCRFCKRREGWFRSVMEQTAFRSHVIFTTQCGSKKVRHCRHCGLCPVSGGKVHRERHCSLIASSCSRCSRTASSSSLDRRS